MTKHSDRSTAQGQTQPTKNPSFNNFLTELCDYAKQPPMRTKLDLPPVPLSGSDFELMAYEIPLINRLVTFHALRILATLGSKPDATTEQQQLLSAALDAKAAINSLQTAAEKLSRRRYPKALWIGNFDDLTEEEDPFEYLPILFKIRKRGTDAQGTENDKEI